MSDELKWCLAIVGIILLSIIIIVIVRKTHKSVNKQEYPGLLEALGGFENISNISLNGSRISMNFENKSNINKDRIKENGVETVVVSNKKITLVIGKDAPVVYQYLMGLSK